MQKLDRLDLILQQSLGNCVKATEVMQLTIDRQQDAFKGFEESLMHQKGIGEKLDKELGGLHDSASSLQQRLQQVEASRSARGAAELEEICVETPGTATRRLDEHERTLKKLQQAQEELKTELGNHTGQPDRNNQELSHIGNHIYELKLRQEELKTEFRKHAGDQPDTDSQNLAVLQRNLCELKQQQEQLKTELGKHTGQRDKGSQELAFLENNVHDLKLQQEELKTEFRKHADGQPDKDSQDLADLLNNVRELKQQQELVAILENNICELKQQQEQLKTELGKHTGQRDKGSQELAVLENNVRELKLQQEELKTELQKYTIQPDKSSQDLALLENNVHEMQTRQEGLKVELGNQISQQDRNSQELALLAKEVSKSRLQQEELKMQLGEQTSQHDLISQKVVLLVKDVSESRPQQVAIDAVVCEMKLQQEGLRQAVQQADEALVKAEKRFGEQLAKRDEQLRALRVAGDRSREGLEASLRRLSNTFKERLEREKAKQAQSSTQGGSAETASAAMAASMRLASIEAWRAACEQRQAAQDQVLVAHRQSLQRLSAHCERMPRQMETRVSEMRMQIKQDIVANALNAFQGEMQLWAKMAQLDNRHAPVTGAPCSAHPLQAPPVPSAASQPRPSAWVDVIAHSP